LTQASSQEFNLSFSKTTADSLPIMSFRVETTQPCLKPNQTPYSYRSPYYPLENDRANECTEEINTQLDSDSRYTKLGSVSVSEYDIQSSSGVLTKLKDLQLASKYVG
jgi:hypothetical protein